MISKPAHSRKASFRTPFLSALAGGLLVTCLTSRVASACAVCFGDPNSSQTHGMNWAILTMLGFIAVVFAGLGSFVFTLWRRAQRAANVSAADESLPAELWVEGHPAQ